MNLFNIAYLRWVSYLFDRWIGCFSQVFIRWSSSTCKMLASAWHLYSRVLTLTELHHFIVFCLEILPSFESTLFHVPTCSVFANHQMKIIGISTRKSSTFTMLLFSFVWVDGQFGQTAPLYCILSSLDPFSQASLCFQGEHAQSHDAVERHIQMQVIEIPDIDFFQSIEVICSNHTCTYV